MSELNGTPEESQVDATPVETVEEVAEIVAETVEEEKVVEAVEEAVVEEKVVEAVEEVAAEETKATVEVVEVEELVEVVEVEEVAEVEVAEVEEVAAAEDIVEEAAVAEVVETVEAAPVVEVAPVEAVPSMDEFAAEIDASLARVDIGDLVECSVISVGEEELIVNLGYIADGLIKKEELLLDPDQGIKDAYKVGDVLKAEVQTMNDGEGNVRLSEKKAVQMIVWDELEEHYKNGTRLTVKVSNVVKGGVTAMIKGIRAFMPASMLAARYVEDLNEFVGQDLEVIVKDFDRRDRKVIISHKEIDKELRDQVQKTFFEEVQKGQVFNGTVKKLMNFGAFVDLGSVDGLVHINEMSWKRIKHPSEVMKEGDVVEVYVINIDKDKQKISLGLKNIDNNPWDDIEAHYTVGKVYEGQVVRLAGFGAFVKIGEGIEGLVHISEISHQRIDTPASVLSEGQEVKVKVIKIDAKAKKISLSIKATSADEEAVELEKYTTTEEATTSLESVFKDILKDLK